MEEPVCELARSSRGVCERASLCMLIWVISRSVFRLEAQYCSSSTTSSITVSAVIQGASLGGLHHSLEGTVTKLHRCIQQSYYHK